MFLFKHSKVSIHEKMWKKINRFANNGKPSLSVNRGKHIQMVLEGNYAFLLDETAARFEIATSCGLAIVKEKFHSMAFSAGLQKNSVYTPIFSKQ